MLRCEFTCAPNGEYSEHLEGGNRKKVIPEDNNPTTTLPEETIAKKQKLKTISPYH